MSQISPNSVVQRATRILFSRVDDQMLAVDAEEGECYSLNETASAVWTMLERPVTVNVIVEKLCADYAVDPATCTADLVELLEALCDAKLVKADDVT
jgi:hypothetical protein